MEYRSTIQVDRKQLNKINQFLEMTKIHAAASPSIHLWGKAAFFLNFK